MADPFLTPDEIQTLTGRVRRRDQVRWLQDRGWPHEVNAGGRPIVLHAEMERRLMGGDRPRGRGPRLELLRAGRDT